MAETWRLLDTGLDSAARNIALSRAVLEARQADEIPSTLRFLRFSRSALLGLGQSAVQVLDVEHCLAHGIAVQRRLTVGPALYVDERQLGWELFVHRRDLGPASLHSISQRICHAAATAVSALGVKARYRAQSDIEVEGRTIGSGGIAVDGEALLFQGVLAIDLDAERMREVFRAPAARSAGSIAAQELRAGLNAFLVRRLDLRLVKHNLVEAFESEFDVEFREGELSLSEERRFLAALCEIDTQGWIDLVMTKESGQCRE